jgi:dTDP-4-amino-4,6-dideoxygalactose transaminase
MKPIKFFDISRQDKKIQKEIIIKISNSIKKNKFILTKEVSNFENEFANFCGTKFAIGVGNGTDAIYIALKSLGLKKNDEVIIPAMTWKSTIVSVSNCQLKPVLVDINKDNSNINLDDLKKKISKKTRAIIIVHLYGNPADTFQIKKLIKNKNIKLIEDAAQAHGARDVNLKKNVGSLGDLACFSFYPGKNLGAYGDAGCITTNNLKYYKKALSLRNIGIFNNKNKSDCNDIGINSRLDTIQSIILSAKLKKINTLNNNRVKIANYYNKNINNKNIIKLRYSEGSVYHQYVIKTNKRNLLIKKLKENKIEFGIHYKTSINKLKYYKSIFRKFSFNNAEDLAAKCISLPMDPLLSKKEQNRIIKVLNNFSK